MFYFMFCKGAEDIRYEEIQNIFLFLYFYNVYIKDYGEEWWVLVKI